jgi:hypothetical protein
MFVVEHGEYSSRIQVKCNGLPGVDCNERGPWSPAHNGYYDEWDTTRAFAEAEKEGFTEHLNRNVQEHRCRKCNRQCIVGE